MSWKIFLQGLAAAAIGGSATAATQYMTSTTALKGKELGITAGIGALIGVLAFLKQSPIQPEEKK